MQDSNENKSEIFRGTRKGVRCSSPTNLNRLYFHHMVGTGGNTFTNALAASTPNLKIVQITDGAHGISVGDTSLLTSDMDRKLFYGHNLFGLLEKAGINDRYFTMLRNPYDRLITDFFWLFGNMKTILFGEAKPPIRSLPIIAFFKKHLHEPEMITAHQAMVSFGKFVDVSDHLEFYIHHCGPLNFDNAQHFQIGECSILSNAAANELARNNLDNKFWLVGITELFEESLFVAAANINIQKIHPWWTCSRPRTPFRPAFMDLSRNLRSAIEKKTGYDMALYEDYRRKFETRFQAEVNVPEFVSYFNEGHPCLI